MDTTLKLSDLVIAAATFLGPILAVQAQKLLERRRFEKDQRLRVFKTLWTTRVAKLSHDHVTALNMISLEFPERKYKKVRRAWQVYLAHLGVVLPEEKFQPVFFQERNRLFTELLQEISEAVGFDFDRNAIEKEAYSTKFQENFENDNTIIRQKLALILNGKAAFPMDVVGFPGDPNASENAKMIADLLREWKSLPVSIIAKKN
jgi:hypothetical protein